MDYKNIFDFTNKTVVIVGGTGSLGIEMVKSFSECGANVAIVGRNIKKANEIKEELSTNGNLKAIACDITSIDSINNMVKEVLDWTGKIDILINHAGLNIRKNSLEFTEEDWDQIIDTNLKGIFFTAQAVGRVMVEQNYGKIINTASVSSVRGHPNLAIYASSKGGLIQMTKVLANEWALNNINVNAIGPGYVVTQQTEEYISDPDVFKSLTDRIPMKRLGTTMDVACGAMFLASKGADYITGHTLYIEGGRLID